MNIQPKRPHKQLRQNNIASFVKNSVRSVKSNPKMALLILVFILILVSQVATFINKGEILGIRVRTVKKQSSTPSTIKGLKVDVNKSLICKSISADYVKDLVGKNVTASTLYADIKNGDLTSNSTCIYSTDLKSTKAADRVVVTVSLQEKESNDLAAKEVKKINGKNDVVTLDSYQDEAYFSKSNNQLSVRDGNKVVNIFISSQDDSSVQIEGIAREIAQKLLN